MPRRSTRLHPTWRKYRAQRRRELIEAGMDRDRASRIAQAESRGRNKIARLVGHTAALDATLIVAERGREFRIFLTGALDDVPPARRPRVEDLSDETLRSIR
jgi:hypothetical protein